MWNRMAMKRIVHKRAVVAEEAVAAVTAQMIMKKFDYYQSSILFRKLIELF